MKIYGITCLYDNCLDSRSHKCFSCNQNTDPNKNNLSKYSPDMQYAIPIENRKPLYKMEDIIEIGHKKYKIIKIDNTNNTVIFAEV